MEPLKALSTAQIMKEYQVTRNALRLATQSFTNTCKRQKRGHARIVENSGKHFSKVRSEDSLELKEGYLIETSESTLK